MALGYSHPVVFKLPEGRRRPRSTRTRVILAGADRDLLGQTAAKVRELRPPEPYKGKGVKYVEEVDQAEGRQGRRHGSGGGSKDALRPSCSRRDRRKEGSTCSSTQQEGAARSGIARSASGSRAPRSGRAWRCSAARATSTPRSSTISSKTHADRDLRQGRSKSGADEADKKARAKKVGAAIAKKCLEKGIDKVVFDRDGYKYHGRVSALADGAREAA